MREHPAPLPGGIGVSRLRVYDTVAPDGLVGGTRTCTCAAQRVRGDRR
ncbi:hypothetical protein NKG94_11730 [Micromonospora sp. M12]